eukprot:3941461-Rhodomonas_salina.3
MAEQYWRRQLGHATCSSSTSSLTPPCARFSQYHASLSPTSVVHPRVSTARGMPYAISVPRIPCHTLSRYRVSHAIRYLGT